MPLAISADFAILPVGHRIAQKPFTHGSIAFTCVDPSDPQEIVSIGGEQGLRFRRVGLQMRLPDPSSAVVLRIGSGGGAVAVHATNAAGQVVYDAIVPIHHAVVDVPLGRVSVARINLSQGSDEAVLIRANYQYG